MRLERGLSVAAAARKANLSESTIRRIEKEGITRCLLTSTILPMLDAYGIKSAKDLFECSDFVERAAEIGREIDERRARMAQH